MGFFSKLCIFKKKKATKDILYVIAVISNPQQFKSRISLYKQFASKIQLDHGVKLITVEHAQIGDEFSVTKSKNSYHVQLRGDSSYKIWLKEALINRGFKQLYKIDPNWKYAAWVDADIFFANKDWALKTIEALKTYSIVQPWTHSIDMGPDGTVMTNEWGNDVDRSFCAAYQAGVFENKLITQPYYSKPKNNEDWRHHCGYAWAIRRETYEGLGGLIDWLVTGSSDYHMAMGFIGQLKERSKLHKQTRGYFRRLSEFQDSCAIYVKGNIGAVGNTILHGFHGYKSDRQYISRHQIILDSNFDPDIDLIWDKDQIPHLTGNNQTLTEGLVRYLSSRNEDNGFIDCLSP